MVNIFKWFERTESEAKLSQANKNKLETYRRIAEEIKYTHSALEKDQRPIIDQYMTINKKNNLEKRISEFEKDLFNFERNYKSAIGQTKNYWSAIERAINSTNYLKDVAKKTRGYEILRIIHETTHYKPLIIRWNKKAFDEQEVRDYIIELKYDKKLTNKRILRKIAHKYKHTMCVKTMKSYLMSNLLEYKHNIEHKYNIVLT
jgi:hypothetical protein